MNILLSCILLLTFCSSFCMEQSNKRSAQDAQLEDRQVSAKETKVNNSTNNNEQDDKQKEEDILLIRTSDSKGVYPISRQAFSLLPYFQALTHGFKETNNNEIILKELTWKELITILRVMETYIGIQTDRKTSIGMDVEFKYLYSDILQDLASAFVSSGYNIENITELFSTAELINFSLLQQAISYYICKKNYGPTFITHIVDDNSKNAGTVSLNNKMASLVNFHHFLQHKQLLTKDSSKKTSYNILKHWNVLSNDIVCNLNRFLRSSHTPQNRNTNFNVQPTGNSDIDLQIATLNSRNRELQQQQNAIFGRIHMLRLAMAQHTGNKPAIDTNLSQSQPTTKEILEAEQTLKDGFAEPDKCCFKVHPNFFRYIEEGFKLIQSRYYLSQSFKAPTTDTFRYVYLLSKGQHPTCKGIVAWPELASMNFTIQDFLDWDFDITLGSGNNSTQNNNTNSNSNNNSNNAAPWIYIINRGLMRCQGLENVPHIEDVQQMMINHNPIESIDSQDFKKLTALQHLNLSNNNINSIDPELFKLLTQLKTIDLSHNKLPALPGTISNLTQLQSLIAESNLIPRLDHNTLTSMQQLQLLDLSNNKLVQLPALNLPNLETLLINNNSFFRDVPQDIVNLTNLKALNLLGTLLARDSQRIKELRKAFGKRVKITTRHSKNNN